MNVIITDVLRFSTPVLTIVGMGFIWRQIVAAKEQAQAGLEAAKATEKQAIVAMETLEHIKLNTKPRLVLTPKYYKISDVEGILLTVENYGSVMAVCYFLTLRNDISIQNAYDIIQVWRGSDFKSSAAEERLRIRDLIIKADGTVSFFFPINNQFNMNNHTSYKLHSSLTLYYGDGLGSYSTAKVHYAWSKPQNEYNIEMVGREFKDIADLSLNIYAPSDIRVYSEPEGMDLPRDLSMLRVLHMTDMQEKVMKLEMPGINLTNKIPLKVVKYSFDWNGWPIITAKVEGKEEWVISLETAENSNKIILNHPSKTPEELGLRFTLDQDQKEKLALYSHLLGEMIGSTSTDLQKKYPTYLRII